jgi:hypothetical protein
MIKLGQHLRANPRSVWTLCRKSSKSSAGRGMGIRRGFAALAGKTGRAVRFSAIRGGARYRLSRRRALTPGALVVLFPGVRLRVASAAVPPALQPVVVEPATEQLTAVDDPADADQP